MYCVPGVIPAVERTEAGMGDGERWDEVELAGLSRGHGSPHRGNF